MPDTAQENTKQASPFSGTSREQTVGSDSSSRDLSDGLLQAVPLEVRPRYEEDVSAAYRSWYKEQVIREQRPELGRFLFGVSFATIGLFATIAKLSPVAGSSAQDLIWLGWAIGVLLLSSGCSLYLAVPKNRLIDPNRVELVKLHKATTDELRIFSLAWLCLWIIGLLIGVIALLF